MQLNYQMKKPKHNSMLGECGLWCHLSIIGNVYFVCEVYK